MDGRWLVRSVAAEAFGPFAFALTRHFPSPRVFLYRGAGATGAILGTAIGAVAYPLMGGDEPSPAEVAAHEIELVAHEMPEDPA